MAVDAAQQNGKVAIYYQAGLSDTGTPVIKSRTFSDVNYDASNEEICDVCNALGSLMEHTVTKIAKIDITNLRSAG